MNFTKNGQAISQIGYGAMVLEGFYGVAEEQIAIDTLVYAINRNVMIDTADAYGAGHNESLIKEAAKKADKSPFIATKFGIVFDEDEDGTMFDTGWGFPLKINGRPEYVKKSIDASLSRLDVDCIDLLYAHYLDPNVPVEDTVGAMADAVKAGKVNALGLSNVTADEIKRAAKVTNIAAVQYEYSISRREVENEILPVINDIGASLVCWSPLGSGFLTGDVANISEEDFRNNNPKYQSGNFQSNLKIIEQLKGIAADLNITPAQLALAWLMHRGKNIIPIPGSRKIGRVDENLKALDIKLPVDVMQKIDDIAPIGAFKGETLV